MQDVSPNSAYIMWETDMGLESVVEWGLEQDLGNVSEGDWQYSNGGAVIHTVKLDSLERFTKYYYRVKTDTAYSEVFRFKTPPFASDNESFRIVAMSDMQQQADNADAYTEIVQDGILDYFEDEFEGELIDNLALVMIPGDLVQNGNIYEQWEHGFFDPSHGLFNQVPVYPVLGNHDQNSVYYFQYFQLPDNGSPGYGEHWWYKDHGNVRIIGLDSNGQYDIPVQSEWLDSLLTETCGNDSIDYVFAQLHHFHKSEMNMPVFDNFTKEAMEQLQEFSTACDKPSIHFFGHNHNYSRGYSRDHKHVWMNVASAGGGIHEWDPFWCQDHEEFPMTLDDWGFVTLEIVNDDEPRLIIQRVSRGDDFVDLDNVITDSSVLRLEAIDVETPTPVYPVNELLPPECVVLDADAFSSPDPTAEHGQSHWQISENEIDFSDPVFDSWKQHENWYFDVDTQAEDDLTDEEVTGIEPNTDYWWRVRYRDKDLNWSSWCDAVPFSTSNSLGPENLLLNPGAEDDLDNWTIEQGTAASMLAGDCNGTDPYTGNRYFAVGGLCEADSLPGILTQLIDVSAYQDSIATGDFEVSYGAYMSNWAGDDLPEMRLYFLDDSENLLEVSNTVWTLNSSWTLVSNTHIVPQGCAVIKAELEGTWNAGSFNDSYFDDVFVQFGEAEFDCDEVVGIDDVSDLHELMVISPNPVNDIGVIHLSHANLGNVRTVLSDMTGSIVACKVEYQSNRILVHNTDNLAGLYIFSVYNKGRLIGRGKVIFQH